jgi:hypothetical protein
MSEGCRFSPPDQQSQRATGDFHYRTLRQRSGESEQERGFSTRCGVRLRRLQPAPAPTARNRSVAGAWACAWLSFRALKSKFPGVWCLIIIGTQGDASMPRPAASLVGEVGHELTVAIGTLHPRFSPCVQSASIHGAKPNTKGVPPALPGRQSKFDVSGGMPRLSIDETPEREPPKHTHMEFHRWTSTKA